jgi:hypothetical protein
MSRQSSPARQQSAVQPLVVSRKTAAALLGDVDVSTLRRFEAAGLLKPIRLNKRSPVAQVFYAYDEVVALAQGGDDAR